jgi:hypothetical protein
MCICPFVLVFEKKALMHRISQKLLALTSGTGNNIPFGGSGILRYVHTHTEPSF